MTARVVTLSRASWNYSGTVALGARASASSRFKSAIAVTSNLVSLAASASSRVKVLASIKVATALAGHSIMPLKMKGGIAGVITLAIQTRIFPSMRGNLSAGANLAALSATTPMKAMARGALSAGAGLLARAATRVAASGAAMKGRLALAAQAVAGDGGAQLAIG